jgi:hypothetical protein
MDRPIVDQATLADRVRQIRRERYGEAGPGALADGLGLPEGTWRNYEAGVMMPAAILLLFIEATRAHPHWLLTGQGDRYL